MTKRLTKRSTFRCMFPRVGRSLRDVTHVFEALDEDELEKAIATFCRPHVHAAEFGVSVDLDEGFGFLRGAGGEFTIERIARPEAPRQRTKRATPYHQWKVRPDLSTSSLKVSVCMHCGDLRHEETRPVGPHGRLGVTLKYVAHDGDGVPQWQATQCERVGVRACGAVVQHG